MIFIDFGIFYEFLFDEKPSKVSWLIAVLGPFIDKKLYLYYICYDWFDKTKNLYEKAI